MGQSLIAFMRSPMIRAGIALLFAIPAGFAGFQAAHALGSLATDNSMLLAILGSIAAMATSLSAWRSVTMSERDTHVTSKFRSEARRVGKECFRKCRSRWSPYH